VFDQFTGSLQNGGERLALVKPGATPADDLTISDVRYDSRLPWPTSPDGQGPSLQLIDPAQDTYRVGNWAATTTNALNQVTPGRTNTTYFRLAPFPALWINEVQPVNTGAVTNHAGQNGPWIELYNSGEATLDLSGYYLTDEYTNLTRWKFPDSASLGPRQFVVVWADGNDS